MKYVDGETKLALPDLVQLLGIISTAPEAWRFCVNIEYLLEEIKIAMQEELA